MSWGRCGVSCGGWSVVGCGSLSESRACWPADQLKFNQFKPKARPARIAPHAAVGCHCRRNWEELKHRVGKLIPFAERRSGTSNTAVKRLAGSPSVPARCAPPPLAPAASRVVASPPCKPFGSLSTASMKRRRPASASGRRQRGRGSRRLRAASAILKKAPSWQNPRNWRDARVV